jgi:hypothetical protein
MGYFYKIAKSDIFVLMDNVQFSNNGMHNYNYIKGPYGRHKITIPVSYKSGALINQVKIYNHQKQIKAVRRAIQQYYSRSPHFEEVYSDVNSIFDYGFEFLYEMNIAAIKMLTCKFGIRDKVAIRAPDSSASKDERLIEMCKEYGADVYLSGPGGLDYHVPEKWSKVGIKLIYSDYQYDAVVYPQRYGDFIPNLSVLDWIFNMGYTLPKGWIRNG